MPPDLIDGKFAEIDRRHTIQYPESNLRLPPTRRNVPIFNASPMVGRLVAACIIAYVVTFLLPTPVAIELYERFAFVSARYTTAGAWQFDPAAYVLGPVTHLFLHGGLVHLLLNMAMFLAFGTPIERRLTGATFTLLYAICGLAGACGWLLFHPDAINPLVGASGAISGMVGAVGRLSLSSGPRADMPFRNRKTALVFVILWLVFNFIFGVVGLAMFGMEGDVAWEAHLGGFVAGFLLIGLFTRLAGADTSS